MYQGQVGAIHPDPVSQYWLLASAIGRPADQRLPPDILTAPTNDSVAGVRRLRPTLGSMKVTPSHIQFMCGQKSITIRGELVYPDGESHFAFGRRSINRWDDGSEVDPSEVELVISEAAAQGARAGIRIDVESPNNP